MVIILYSIYDKTYTHKSIRSLEFIDKLVQQIANDSKVGGYFTKKKIVK